MIVQIVQMFIESATMCLQRSLPILSILSIACASVAADSVNCLASENNYKCRLNTMTPYRFIANLNDTELKYSGCEATKIWMFFRHGTRFPGKKMTNTLIAKLPTIRDSIVKSHRLGDGRLTDEEAELLRNWEISFTSADAMFLAPEGERELASLAERFQSRYPALMPEIYSNRTYTFKYTATQRAEESAKYFALGLFGRKQSRDVWYPQPEYKDPVLRFYKRCKRWREEIDNNPESYRETEKFVNSTIIVKMLSEVSERVGFELDYDTVRLIHTICGFETAWNEKKDSPWCSLLPLEHFKVLEFAHDLQYYWIDGYGYPLTYQQSCVAMKDMFDFFQSDAETKVRAYFTHSGALLKLLGLLGIARDESPLTHESFSYEENRHWRTTRIDAFASSIVFVLYDCETQGPSILLLHQERAVQLPGCPVDTPCPLSIMKNNYPDTEAECRFDEICAVES